MLEMGEPVSILDLAKDMIRLVRARARRATSRSRSSAARPGEKLHEELFNPYERPAADAGAARSCAPSGRAIDPAWVEETFDQIGLLVLEGDAAGLAADGRRARERSGWSPRRPST